MTVKDLMEIGLAKMIEMIKDAPPDDPLITEMRQVFTNTSQMTDVGAYQTGLGLGAKFSAQCMAKEEAKKKVNRPVRELALAEDADMVGLKAGRDGNGNGRPPTSQAAPAPAARPVKTLSDSVAHLQQDAPTCPNCGHVTVRNGACYKCLNCGESLGCS